MENCARTARKDRLALPLRPVAALGIKSKNPACAVVKREAEEDWGKEKWR
jgi:hypothetical protein